MEERRVAERLLALHLRVVRAPRRGLRPEDEAEQVAGALHAVRDALGVERAGDGLGDDHGGRVERA